MRFCLQKTPKLSGYQTSGIVDYQSIVIWFLKIAISKSRSSPESSVSLKITVKYVIFVRFGGLIYERM